MPCWRGQSDASLALDVIGAFDAVIREAVFEHEQVDYRVAAALSKLGFGPETMHELAKAVAAGSILAEAGMSRHAVALLQQAHETTWVTTQGLQIPTVTLTGSRAGDPLGDLIYNFLAAKVSCEVDAELEQRGLRSVLPPAPVPLQRMSGDEPMVMPEASFVDDVMIFVVACDAINLLAKLAAVASVVVDVYSRRGLCLNFKAGKTEALIRLRGAESKRAYASLVLGLGGELLLKIADCKTQLLRVVPWYRHMGGIIHPDGRMRLEVRARAAAMHDALRNLRPTMRRHTLSKDVKLHLAGALCHSRLMFNSAVWSVLKPSDLRKVNSAYMAPLRAATSMQNVETNEERYTNQCVLDASACESAQNHLRRELLAYVVRLFTNKHTVILRLIALNLNAKAGWATRVRDALSALWRASAALQKSMPDPFADLERWLQVIADNPRAWRPVFRTAPFAANSCSKGGPAGQHDIIDQYVCPCGKVFHDRASLLCHQAGKHGYNNPFKRKIDSSICLGCSKQFHTPWRIFRHVAYASKQCRPVYESLPDLEPEVIDTFWGACRRPVQKSLLKPPVLVDRYAAD